MWDGFPLIPWPIVFLALCILSMVWSRSGRDLGQLYSWQWMSDWLARRLFSQLQLVFSSCCWPPPILNLNLKPAMKFADCVKLLFLASVPTLATFWPSTSSKSNRRAFTSKSLSTYTWPESSLKRDGSSDVKALVFLSHGYAEHLSPYYDSLGEACASQGVFCWGHDHVGHGTSPGARTEVNFLTTCLSNWILIRGEWDGRLHRPPGGSVQTEEEGVSRS